MKPPLRAADLPDVLRQRTQWVRYRADKRPWHATANRPGSSTDRTTWSTFEAACAGVGDHGCVGVGFALCADDPFVAIDFDHVVSDAGSVPAWVAEFLRAAGSYAEYSPSFAGLHVWLEGTWPHPGGTFDDGAGHAVEIYATGRYMTVTGDRLDSAPPSIRHAPAFLQRLARWAARCRPAAQVVNFADAAAQRVTTHRHAWLRRQAWRLAGDGLPVETVLAALCALRDSAVDRGHRLIVDAELRRLAASAVSKRRHHVGR